MSREIKTHYEPYNRVDDYYGEEKPIKGYCGTYLQEFEDNYTIHEEELTCKKCLKLFEKAKREKEAEIEHECNDMQDFIDYMNSKHLSQ